MPISDDIEAAAHRLRAGGVVAFPTETVYGLGADARQPAAVRRVFTLKGRPADHPLIVHLGEAAMMMDWARAIPAAAERLAAHFWPGPLTLILQRGQAPLEVTGGQDSIGLRVPDHPVALALLRAFGGGVAAPSANRFGRISPTRATHVLEELGDAPDLILEGGDCRVGLESTILSLVGEQPVLLRPGAIARAALESVIGQPIAEAGPAPDIRAPGLLASHYAPVTPLLVYPVERLDGLIMERLQRGQRLALMTRTPWTGPRSAALHVQPMPSDADAYGHALYATLRALDHAGFDVIIAEQPPVDEPWRAVNDRLGRASHDSTR